MGSVTRHVGRDRFLPRGRIRFEILGQIRNPETIARGRSLRNRRRIERAYGQGRWRKRKGTATVRLSSGEIRDAEVHWYEATGIGRREYKIKGFLDQPADA